MFGREQKGLTYTQLGNTCRGFQAEQAEQKIYLERGAAGANPLFTWSVFIDDIVKGVLNSQLSNSFVISEFSMYLLN